MESRRSITDSLRVLSNVHSSVSAALIAGAFVLAAIVAPVFLAQSVFGGWLEAETILIGSTWGAAVAFFIRELYFGRLDSVDVLIACVTVLVIVGVLFNQLREAGIIATTVGPQ